jgi:hypothetical protein
MDSASMTKKNVLGHGHLVPEGYIGSCLFIIRPIVNYIKLFSLSLTKRENKQVCIPGKPCYHKLTGD